MSYIKSFSYFWISISDSDMKHAGQFATEAQRGHSDFILFSYLVATRYNSEKNKICYLVATSYNSEKQKTKIRYLVATSYNSEKKQQKTKFAISWPRVSRPIR
jgi:hypothetical protein